MSYWWQNLLTRRKMKGQPILKVTGEGCQAIAVFDWIGKVIGFEQGRIFNGRDNKCEYVIIEIIKHNHSYGDSRDNAQKEIFKYPLVNADIQNVNGVWILFT